MKQILKTDGVEGPGESLIGTPKKENTTTRQRKCLKTYMRSAFQKLMKA